MNGVVISTIVYLVISGMTALFAGIKLEDLWYSQKRARRFWAIVILTCWAWPIWWLVAIGKGIWNTLMIALGKD